MRARAVLTLVDILRLRAGPQDLPAGWGLAIVLLAAYVIQGLLADRMLGEPDTVPRSLVAIAIQFLTIAALLNARGYAMRLPQTLAALSGTGFIFGIVSLALISRADPERNQPLLALFWFALFLWSLAVDGHIYRHALSITMSLGVLVAVLIFAASFFLLEVIF